MHRRDQGDLQASSTLYARLSRSGVHRRGMSIQIARRNNLRALVADLQQQGVHDWDEIARRVGCTAGATRLKSMLDRGFIGAWFSHCLEHSLSKPRRWLDQDHTLGPDHNHIVEILADGQTETPGLPPSPA